MAEPIAMAPTPAATRSWILFDIVNVNLVGACQRENKSFLSHLRILQNNTNVNFHHLSGDIDGGQKQFLVKLRLNMYTSNPVGNGIQANNLTGLD